LNFVAEHVVVAPRFEVQDRSHPQHEVFGVLERPPARSANREQRRIGQLGDGLRAEQIAQAAGRLFHVGFELIQGVVEAGVTLGNQRLQLAKGPDRGLRHIRCGDELVEQRRIADDDAGVGEREEKLRIVGFERGPFVHFADVMSERQPEIPQRREKGVKEAFVERTDRPREEHQDVDIGMQTQLAAAVAAEREDRHRLCGRAGIREDLLQERVHAVRILTDRQPPRLPAHGRGRELAARGFEPCGTSRAGVARECLGLGHEGPRLHGGAEAESIVTATGPALQRSRRSNRAANGRPESPPPDTAPAAPTT
jgi:hypothetical protein